MNWVKAYMLAAVYVTGIGGAVESALTGKWGATVIFIQLLIVFTAVYLLIEVERASVRSPYYGAFEESGEQS